MDMKSKWPSVAVPTRRLLVIALAALTPDCGGTVNDGETGVVGPCKSEIVGTWNGVTRNDRLEIFPDRSFKYEGADGCTSQGSIGSCPGPTAAGALDVFVSQSAGASCLPLGNHTCSITLSATTFTYDCSGGGSLEYAK